MKYGDELLARLLSRFRRNKTRDEQEFTAAAIEIIERSPSPTFRVTGFGLALFVIGGLVWACFGRVDVYAVAIGKLVPRGNVKVIEPSVPGTLVELPVRSGDQVKQGDVLARLDDTDASAELSKVNLALRREELTVERLRSVIDLVKSGKKNTEQSFIGESPENPLQLEQLEQLLAAFHAEQKSLEAEIDQRRTQINTIRIKRDQRAKIRKLASERLDLYRKLEDAAVGIKSQTISAEEAEQNQVLEILSDNGQIEAMRSEVNALLTRKAARKEALLETLTKDLYEADQKAQSLRQDLIKAEKASAANTIYAPTDGQVQQLGVTSIGQVIRPGQKLMIVVPQNAKFELEGHLKNQDVALAKKGQIARIKLEAFPYTVYGVIEGRVQSIAKEASERPNNGLPPSHSTDDTPSFPIRILLLEQKFSINGKDVGLTAGMAATAEIKVGNRRVIQYLLDPITATVDEAFHER